MNNLNNMCLFLIPLFLFLGSCSKERPFLYQNKQHLNLNTPADPLKQKSIPPHVSKPYKFQGEALAGKLDVLWVIDNSGSMQSNQDNVAINTEKFMTEFTKRKYIDWQVGLISTAVKEDPYIGILPESQPLNRTTINPVQKFIDAVNRLGTDGDSNEVPIQTTKNIFESHPKFLRSKSVLAIFIVTDIANPSLDLSAKELLNYLTIIRGGDFQKTFVYTALGATDFNCPVESPWQYKGSQFEELVKQTKGKALKICDPDFGIELSKIGEEIANQVEKPYVFLDKRPIPETIVVKFREKELKMGDSRNGGYWVYDYEKNAIIFNDLGFAAPSDDLSEVTLTFDEDLGDSGGYKRPICNSIRCDGLPGGGQD
jgi:hypothetical protein